MSMINEVEREFEQLQKQIINDNRKLEALRMVIKEYATEEYPGNARLNVIIMECMRKHNGRATFQEILECVESHQITLPRSKLSLLLTGHNELEYVREEKLWKIKALA